MVTETATSRDQPNVATGQRAYELAVAAATGSLPSGDDLFDALGALAALDWAELWTTLERLATYGQGLEGRTFLELFHERATTAHGLDDRVLGAVVCVLLTKGGRTIQTTEDLQNSSSLARIIPKLSGRDQLQIADRLGLTGTNGEGAIATLVAAAMQDNSPVRDLGTIPRLTSSFTFGDWARPGGQPVGLYIGSQAHAAIGAYYSAAHPPPAHLVWLNYAQISIIVQVLAKQFGLQPEKLATALRLSKPDIFDFSLAHPPYVYEIKPWSLAEVAVAEAKYYTNALNQADVPAVLGPRNVPGTYGELPAPNGYFVFEAPAEGVIAYQYLRAAPHEILARDQRRRRKSAERDPVSIPSGVVITAGALALLVVLLGAGWLVAPAVVLGALVAG